MMNKIKIPQYAKENAKRGLFLNSQLPKSRKAGLTVREARNYGINSGRKRARQLIKARFISLKDAKSIRNFLTRFQNCKTEKCEIAILLWGGREFRPYLIREINRIENE